MYLNRNCLMLALLTTPNITMAQDAATVFARTRDSVYVVRVQLPSGGAQGSAVRISKDAVVTNCHVVRDAVSIALRTKDSEHQAELLHSDVARDLCTLKVPDLPPSEVPPIRKLDTILVGERVVALGAPRGLELSLSEGIIAAVRDTDSGRVLQTTAPISPGSSGGALFDSKARLIGITSFQRRDSQNLNFAAPAEWVAEIPGRHTRMSARAPSPNAEPQLLKLICRGRVKSSSLVAKALKGSSGWTDKVEAELDLAQPAVRLSNFAPTLISMRSQGDIPATVRAIRAPYLLTAIGDTLRHFDSDTKTTIEGMRIVSVEIVINRKTAELTLKDSESSMSTKDFQTNVSETVGEYQCEPDTGRKF